MTVDLGSPTPTRTGARPLIKRVRSRTEPSRGTVVLVHGTMDHSGSFRGWLTSSPTGRWWAMTGVAGEILEDWGKDRRLWPSTLMI